MKLNKTVLDLNRKIKKLGLVYLTWGNVSCISDDRKTIIIKPSGIDLDNSSYKDMSEVCIKTGKLTNGKKQSVDTDIHLEIYKNFNNVNCVVHTHSKFATILAQSKIPIICSGTTHADYFDGTIPVVYDLKDEDIVKDYEKNIGISIVKFFNDKKIDHQRISAALLPSHGPIVWGENFNKTIERALVLEKISEMFYYQCILNCKSSFNDVLLRKHYDRKHGRKKYYGQN